MLKNQFLFNFLILLKLKKQKETINKNRIIDEP